MKTFINIFLLSLILCTACGNRNVSMNQTEATKNDSTRNFVLPVIPAMLTTPESRADYLVRHYWENVDFNDTIWLNHQEMLEQAWVDYIDLMRLVPKETINNALRQVYKNAEKQKPFFSYFTTLADKYLYDPNSPMRNEELYITVLDAMLESDVLDETEKILPNERRKLAERNRPGRLAEDFTYTLSSGKNGTLHDLKAQYTLLFINNPGCHACEESLTELKQAPAINRELEAGRLKILAIYPDEELQEWKRHLSDFPKEWINGYDKGLVIKEKNLYDLKAIPTLYLLDQKKIVILKDAPIREIEEHLKQQP
ncbi:DUF5106 domain-containing protein [uncultured Bacteroides sp.]|uniref:DUF5106 domain-containing protein n=1 Tax=uncultured Bacteroides sp. TaxID=162156 RepID=UPI0023C85F7E|nr:DUF5106 domain-containing protein [uncultured Bacteroides sp.]MDE5701091.1 DUF5106 domain-containing protein [Bacteroides sp.]